MILSVYTQTYVYVLYIYVCTHIYVCLYVCIYGIFTALVMLKGKKKKKRKGV